MKRTGRKVKGDVALHYNLGFIQPIQRMQGPNRQFRVGGIDQQRKLDLRGRDSANIYAAVSEGPKGFSRDASMAAHSNPDDRDFRDIGCAVEALVADLRPCVGYRILGALEIGSRNRKSQISRSAVRRHVLNDHVHIDVGVGQRAENIGRDTRLVRNIADRYLRLVLGKRDSGDDVLFHEFLLVANQSPGRILVRIDLLRRIEARSHEYRHLADHAEFDGAHLKHLRALRGELEHFLERDSTKPPRLRHHAGVGGVDPIDVSVDIAAIGVYGGRNRHRRGIGTAAAQGRDSPGVLVDALEAGNDRDLLAFTQPPHQFVAIYAENAG